MTISILQQHTNAAGAIGDHNAGIDLNKDKHRLDDDKRENHRDRDFVEDFFGGMSNANAAASQGRDGQQS